MAFKDLTFQKMGGWVKKKTTEKIEEFKKESQDKALYKKELNAEITKARRQAFLKESVKQAQLKAVRDAKAKFQPKQNNMFSQNLFSDGMLGSPKKEMLKKDLRKKLKRGSKSEFDDLIWKS